MDMIPKKKSLITDFKCLFYTSLVTILFYTLSLRGEQVTDFLRALIN